MSLYTSSIHLTVNRGLENRSIGSGMRIIGGSYRSCICGSDGGRVCGCHGSSIGCSYRRRYGCGLRATYCELVAVTTPAGAAAATTGAKTAGLPEAEHTKAIKAMQTDYSISGIDHVRPVSIPLLHDSHMLHRVYVLLLHRYHPFQYEVASFPTAVAISIANADTSN
ncbi:hypothetical protein GQX74_003297 [Glossina fuscipes]|nr:hypothetical protein GQX74_003297 [Glossina fuscipes]